MYRVPRTNLVGDGFTRPWDINDFKQRQAADIARYEDADGEYIVRRRPFHERVEKPIRRSSDPFVDDANGVETDDESGEDDEPRGRTAVKDDAGEEGWRNKEGESLADFGVDEVADFYDEDDVPLAELIRRRQAKQQ